MRHAVCNTLHQQLNDELTGGDILEDNPRILVVDDDESTCRSLTLIFGKKGYETETAGTGREALEKSQGRFFNLALLDIRLPDMAGIELIAPLKEMHPDMVVILVTAYASLETAVQALNEGASAYIIKPLNMDVVLATVRQALEKQQLIEEKRRAEEALRQRTAQLEALRQVGLELTAQLDLDTLLHSIVSRAMELVGGDSGGLYLYRSERDLLEWTMAVGPNLTPIGTILHQGEGLSGKVWESGEPLIVDDYQHWEGQASVCKGCPWTAVIGVPIRWGEKFLGVLDVLADPPHTFSSADAELLELFATQAAIAIENARLYEASQRELTERKWAEEALVRMATHDPLTGLPNRRLFNDRLNLELAHARRNQRKLAVMLLDLDHFKDVNDTLGHSMGDKLLQVVGQRLLGLLRKSDTVARMGGDEFTLLLPEIAQAEDATQIAHKILGAFRKPFEFNDHEVRITTSIGIAIYPDDGEDADTLIKNADIAMYRAKDQGRDNYQRYSGKGGRDGRERNHLDR